MDAYGMVTSVLEYEQVVGFNGSPSIVKKTTTHEYLRTQPYVDAFIRNRLRIARIDGTQVAEMRYDESAPVNRYQGGTQPRQHNGLGVGATVRGNATYISGGTTPTTASYDIIGMPVRSDNGTTWVDVQVDSSKNYAVPSVVTPNNTPSLSHSLSWNSHLGLTQDSGPNGMLTTADYVAGRPNSSTSATGTYTTFAYSASAPQKTATTAGVWTREHYDGFGRIAKVETGNGSTTASTVETEYAPCACSPMGKLKRVTRPYAPGGTKYWTTYNYDSLGRTISAVLPDGSKTEYFYQANRVKTTDPAGKWKEFESNSLGQLAKVTEPDPVGGADYQTSYTYNLRGQLTMVSMPRAGYTQTRTFSYDINGRATSTMNPETGSVTMAYWSDNPLENGHQLLKHKVDAKAQKVEYTYDSMRRVTEVKRYKNQNDASPDACQGTQTYWDANPFDGSFAVNTSGRVAAVQYRICTYDSGGALEKERIVREMYQYTAAGQVSKKRFQVTRTDTHPQTGQPVTGTAHLDAVYTWTQLGQLDTLKYPDLYGGTRNGTPGNVGKTLDNGFDSMNRLQNIVESNPANPSFPTTLVSNLTYGAAGELTSLTEGTTVETREYNSVGQMTRILSQSGSTVMDLRYDFAAGANNGQIYQMRNIVSGETISYAYDSLQRLTAANSSLGSGQSQSYGYDGFGNLTQKGAQSIGADPATNRIPSSSVVGYDANGNMTKMPLGSGSQNATYDVQNRMVSIDSTGEKFGYAPNNRRVWIRRANGDEEWILWGPAERPLGTYWLTWDWTSSSGTLWCSSTVAHRWLGYREIGAGIPDRLSSVGSYFSYGELKSGAEGTFASYRRDSGVD